MYPSPMYGPGRRASRLEHAGCPQPFVDPHLIHSAMIAVSGGLPAVEEQIPEKGDETSFDSRQNVGTQSSQLHLSGRSQRPLFFLVEERQLEAGGLN